MIKRILISVLALLLLAANVALAAPAQDCPTEPRLTHSVHKVLYQAQQLMEKKKDAEAAQKLAEFAKNHPDAHPRFWFLRGVLAYQAKQRDEAGVYFSKAMEAWPCFQAAVRNLAVVRYEQGKPAEAARLAHRAFLLSKPKDYNLLFEASVFLLGAGQAAKALPWLEELCAQPQPKKDWLTAQLRPTWILSATNKRPRCWSSACWPAGHKTPPCGVWEPAWPRLKRTIPEPPPPWPWPTAWSRPKRPGGGNLPIYTGPPELPWPPSRYYLKAWGGEPKKIKQLDRLADLYLQGHDMKQAAVFSLKAAKAQAPLPGAGPGRAGYIWSKRPTPRPTPPSQRRPRWKTKSAVKRTRVAATGSWPVTPPGRTKIFPWQRSPLEMP